VLLRLGHPVMRQAMADPCAGSCMTQPLHDPIFRLVGCGLGRTGFEALLAFHYTVTAINEPCASPLHDRGCWTRLFRVEGDYLTRVEDAFAPNCASERLFLPIKSRQPARRSGSAPFRGRWVRQ